MFFTGETGKSQETRKVFCCGLPSFTLFLYKVITQTKTFELSSLEYYKMYFCSTLRILTTEISGTVAGEFSSFLIH